MSAETSRTPDGTTLHLHAWPVSEPRATVAIVHGYGEHGARYAHVARALNDAQVQAFGVDLRGHGHSSGPRGHVARFAEYHQDLDALLEVCRQRAGGKKVFLMGHSMGALASIDYLLAGRGKDVAGLVLSSPFLGVALPANPIKLAAGRVMSRIWPSLALPTGLGGVHVTRDAEQARLYDGDPLNNKNATARWYTEAMAAIEFAKAHARELRVPTFLIYGAADRTADARVTDAVAPTLTMADRTVESVEGGAHELVNDLPETRAHVIQRIVAWVTARA